MRLNSGSLGAVALSFGLSFGLSFSLSFGLALGLAVGLVFSFAFGLGFAIGFVLSFALGFAFRVQWLSAALEVSGVPTATLELKGGSSKLLDEIFGAARWAGG